MIYERMVIARDRKDLKVGATMAKALPLPAGTNPIVHRPVGARIPPKRSHFIATRAIGLHRCRAVERGVHAASTHQNQAGPAFSAPSPGGR